MRDFSTPFSAPKSRLLEAAESLFANQGFDAVSVRDITKEAGANVAAVNYHFGGRDGLISLVVLRYVTPVNEERIARLDAAERRYPGKTVPLEEVIECFTRPIVTAVKRSELSERLFCKLIGRIFCLQGQVPREMEEQMKQVAERYVRALSRSLPDASAEEVVWRFHFLLGGLIHMLTHQEMLARVTDGASGQPSMDTTLSRFIRFAAAGLRDGVAAGGHNGAAEKGPQGMLFDF